MDKKLLMQKAYNWIAEQDENGAIISDGDIDIASEFIAEFIQNLIDNGVLAEPSDENAVLPIHGVIARFLKDKAKEHNTEQNNIVAGIMQDDLYVWDYDGGRAMSLQWQTKDIIDLNGL